MHDSTLAWFCSLHGEHFVFVQKLFGYAHKIFVVWWSYLIWWLCFSSYRFKLFFVPCVCSSYQYLCHIAKFQYYSLESGYHPFYLTKKTVCVLSGHLYLVSIHANHCSQSAFELIHPESYSHQACAATRLMKYKTIHDYHALIINQFNESYII
jgi:hypothetical protein